MPRQFLGDRSVSLLGLLLADEVSDLLDKDSGVSGYGLPKYGVALLAGLVGSDEHFSYLTCPVKHPYPFPLPRR